MLFNSLTFVAFFVIVVTLYWSIGSWTARKNLLVVASYIFYGAWNRPFAARLVSGPVVRSWDVLPQFVHPPRLNTGQFLWGLVLMTLGLFEKIVLADTLLSGSADRVFDYAGPLVALDSWAGVIAFAGQIFFDFAGYSTCAIGAALTLGFHLKDNFRFPYAAIGFSDFWRPWHISLSTFLRDYLYIPLGGNQFRPFLAAFNIVIVI